MIIKYMSLIKYKHGQTSLADVLYIFPSFPIFVFYNSDRNKYDKNNIKIPPTNICETVFY